MRSQNDERPKKQEMNQVQMRMNECVSFIAKCGRPIKQYFGFIQSDGNMPLFLQLVLSIFRRHIGMPASHWCGPVIDTKLIAVKFEMILVLNVILSMVDT